MVETRSSKKKTQKSRGGSRDTADTTTSRAKATDSPRSQTPRKSPIGVFKRLRSKKTERQLPSEEREERNDDTPFANDTRVSPSDNDEPVEAVLSPETTNINGDINAEDGEVAVILKKERQLPSEEREERNNDTRFANDIRVSPSNNDEPVEAVLSPETAGSNEEEVAATTVESTARSFESDDIRLKYPYDIDAAEGLEQLSNDLFDGIEFIELSTKTSSPSPSNGPLRGIVTLYQRDLEKLEPRTLLNDSNIDFFMKWLTRNLPADSDVAIMSSLFYTELDRLGEKAVSRWGRNIDVFSKDIVVVPVTEGLHHSLCAIIHPGSIVYAHNEPKSDYPRSLFLFMDSSRGSHDSARICQNLRGWLNQLWREECKKRAQRVSSPFERRKMPVAIATVPQQPNVKCCGVYVCRNACGLLMLYKRCNGSISTRDTDCALLVSESPEFNYGQPEVEQLRLDMKILVERLSAKYLSWESLQPVDEDEDGSDFEVLSAGSACGAASSIGGIEVLLEEGNGGEEDEVKVLSPSRDQGESSFIGGTECDSGEDGEEVEVLLPSSGKVVSTTATMSQEWRQTEAESSSRDGIEASLEQGTTQDDEETPYLSSLGDPGKSLKSIATPFAHGDDSTNSALSEKEEPAPRRWLKFQAGGTPFAPRIFRTDSEDSPPESIAGSSTEVREEDEAASDCVAPANTNDPALMNLAARFSSLGVSVDPDDEGRDRRSGATDVVDLTEDRVSVDIEFPPGSLGLLISRVDDTWVKISHVQPGCVMYRHCMEGDYLDWIGNWRARGKTLEEVQAELRRTVHMTRFVRVLRLEATVRGEPGSVKCEGGIRSGSGNKEGKAAGRKSEVKTKGQQTESAGQLDGAVETFMTRKGIAVRKERVNRAVAAAAEKVIGIQKKGTIATRLSHLHGKGAESQKKQCYERFYLHGKMVTPAEVIGGVKTTKWPKLLNLHVLVDPFYPSNPNGGTPTDVNSIIRQKKLVVLAAKDQASLDDFKALMTSLVESNWSDTDCLEIKAAFDVESAMVASSGNRRRTLQAREGDEPENEVSATSTPDVRQRRRLEQGELEERMNVA